MFKKVFLIPRGLADATKVFFKTDMGFAEKLGLSKTLLQLKWLSVIKKQDEQVTFEAAGYSVDAYCSTALQFLVKEIFIEKMYSINAPVASSILDLGANIGMSVLFFSRTFPGVKIEAYEPDESSFRLLEKNIAQNKLGTVRLDKKAVGTDNGILYTSADGRLASVNSSFSTTEQGTPVDCVRCCNLLDRHYDIVKMDIEGGEWAVLDDLIANKKLAAASHWLIEFHEQPDFENQLNIVKNAFATSGFEKEERGDIVYFFKSKQIK